MNEQVEIDRSGSSVDDLSKVQESWEGFGVEDIQF